MHRSPSSGLHRKPRSSRALATRTALYAGAAVAAVLTAGASASAATVPASATDLPAPPAFCTGTFFDAFTSCYASTGSGNGGDATGGDTPVLGGGGGE